MSFHDSDVLKEGGYVTLDKLVGKLMAEAPIAASAGEDARPVHRDNGTARFGVEPATGERGARISGMKAPCWRAAAGAAGGPTRRASRPPAA